MRHHGQGDRCLLASHPMVTQVLLHSGLDTSRSCYSQSPHPPARARSGSAGADRALAVVPDSPACPDAVSAPCPSPLVPAAGCRTLRIIPQRSGSGAIRSRSWRRSGSNAERSSAGRRSRTTSASKRPASGPMVRPAAPSPLPITSPFTSRTDLSPSRSRENSGTGRLLRPDLRR
jgi:hypothetical protein